MQNATFDQNSCLELAFPDKNFKDIDALLKTFPTIQLVIENTYYPIYPRDYFYFDSKNAAGVEKYCLTFREESDSMGILGAFNMRNKFIYIDRVSQVVRIV